MKDSGDLSTHWLADHPASCWQGFVYVSDPTVGLSGSADPPSHTPEPLLDAHPLPLAAMRVGDRVRIVSLNCGESNNRLMGMGLMPNVVLEVISSSNTGSVIVALQDQRLGLGAEMAQRIQVTQATPSSAQNLRSPTTRTTTMTTTPDSASIKLRDAAIGSVLRVIGYDPTARDYKRKLLAMGLTPGTELRVTRHAPLGDPTEIEVRDFHLSLRKDEADTLIVTLVTGGEQ